MLITKRRESSLTPKISFIIFFMAMVPPYFNKWLLATMDVIKILTVIFCGTFHWCYDKMFIFILSWKKSWLLMFYLNVKWYFSTNCLPPHFIMSWDITDERYQNKYTVKLNTNIYKYLMKYFHLLRYSIDSLFIKILLWWMISREVGQF